MNALGNKGKKKGKRKEFQGRRRIPPNASFVGLDFLFVLDFEATCDSPRRIANQEIIEFPIVVLDLKEKAIVAEFQEYVRPIENPELTAFCTELTGIEQATVDAADPFEVVLPRTVQFIDNFLMQAKPGAKVTFVTCGDWDLKSMLPLQISLCVNRGIFPIGYSPPQCFRSWVNIKDVFAKNFAIREGGNDLIESSDGGEGGNLVGVVEEGGWKTRRKAPGMKEMLVACGLPLEGHHHSGIDDSRNIAKLALWLACREHPTASSTSVSSI